MKVNFGIHISYTSASIARMIDGQPTIIDDRSTYNMPVCVAFNRRGDIRVGVTALNCSESFSGFLRTIGTDKTYYSSNTNQEYSSEQLLGIVIRTLRSFVKDVDVKASVITVPAMFDFAQVEAIRKAGMLGGLEQVEILMKPLAAVFAYNFKHKIKDGKFVVFDFGIGSFDAALVKAEGGVISVISSEGDNLLGGKDLDNLVIDQVLLPFLRKNYDIDNLDNNALQYLKNKLKRIAERLKIDLSELETVAILTDSDELGKDATGEEIEIDLSITRNELRGVLAPLYQLAIDTTSELLKQNNVELSILDKIALIGGDTLSPILREMIANQLSSPDTSLNPMTAIAEGAAVYAATINNKIDSHGVEIVQISAVELEFEHAATSVHDEEAIGIKRKGTNKNYSVIVSRSDGWQSAQHQLDDVVMVAIKDFINSYSIQLFDASNNPVPCSPNEFTIISGDPPVDGGAPLAYSLGIGGRNEQTGEIVYVPIKGFEKDKTLPLQGSLDHTFRTEKEIRPGIESDFIKIPVYYGGPESIDTRVIYNRHCFDILISGIDLPALLPENSEVDFTFELDISQNISIEAYFPYLDYTHEIGNPYFPQEKALEISWLQNEIIKAKEIVTRLIQKGYPDKSQLQKIDAELISLAKSLLVFNDEQNKGRVLTYLKKTLKVIDEIKIKSNNPSLIEVEDLLFELLENDKIESSVFEKHYDILFDMKKENHPNLDILNEIYKELKTLPNN
jgi:molecular chaperone DnaK